MGEAVYYYKAEFPESALVSHLQEQLKAFHVEGAKAYEFWQDNRDHGRKGQKDQETFWKEFATQFPTIYEYTQFLNIAGKGFDNELCGKMSWGSEEDAENLRFQGNTARYYAEVWHMASWEELGMFLKKKFGAIDFRWMSEEDGDVSFMLDQPNTDEIKEAADQQYVTSTSVCRRNQRSFAGQIRVIRTKRLRGKASGLDLGGEYGRTFA